MKYHLAIDIGASSGRHILGHVEKGCMMLEEIYRFDNIQVRKNGHDCWNTEQLWQSILEGLRACKAVNKVPETMGIDTWAVDFVLMGADGRPGATPWRIGTNARKARWNRRNVACRSRSCTPAQVSRSRCSIPRIS
ncbi:MAG: hypothetical protein ACLRZH_18550 [Ruthenibacterium lactatiformans]